ncbi:hypothetical protein OEZ85_003009 [Tetradesmus obliquus]|uniref:ABC transmembrane type-1 domain-containing protein n=1 Tax=Tetradesmus obliquus TaxID=3088 RepID=A0ABY8TZR6_TETOB|nr:hypothetical protein OEZ85_003009 [Tetradesmus obliquus]
MEVLPRGEQRAQGSQVLGAVLRQQAVRNAGRLMTWTLQRPDLVDPDQFEDPKPTLMRSIAGLFRHSSRILGLTLTGLIGLGASSSVAILAAAMTQQ